MNFIFSFKNKRLTDAKECGDTMEEAYARACMRVGEGMELAGVIELPEGEDARAMGVVKCGACGGPAPYGDTTGWARCLMCGSARFASESERGTECAPLAAGSKAKIPSGFEVSVSRVVGFSDGMAGFYISVEGRGGRREITVGADVLAALVMVADHELTNSIPSGELSAILEGVMCHNATPPSAGGLEFTCPKCGGHRLECIEEGFISSEVTTIDPEGEHDYGPINADNTEFGRFQCLNCGDVVAEGIENERDVFVFCEPKKEAANHEVETPERPPGRSDAAPSQEGAGEDRLP